MCVCVFLGGGGGAGGGWRRTGGGGGGRGGGVGVSKVARVYVLHAVYYVAVCPLQQVDESKFDQMSAPYNVLTLGTTAWLRRFSKKGRKKQTQKTRKK